MRTIAASREQVFAAFSDPRRLERWWGPKGFTNAFHAFDFRPGGAWKFTMRGPDGTAYEMNKQFTEIVVPERIDFRHFQPTHDFVHAITFAEPEEGRTTLTWRLTFDDPAEAAKLRSFILQANEQNFDRLEAHLSDAKS